MADRPRTVWKLKRGIYEAAEWGEVEVSKDDTVTIGSLMSSSNPYNAVFWKMSDGSEVTNTHAANSNVCTITAVVTDEKCIYMAYGIKA
jgi:hypothetical protein